MSNRVIRNQQLLETNKRDDREKMCTDRIGPKLKPRPHQQQCRSNNVERYKLNDSFDSVECCFDIVAIFGNNVAGYGNNVERNFVLSTCSICFDFVERTKFYNRIVRHCCRLGNKVECCFDKVERCFDIVAGVDGALEQTIVIVNCIVSWQSSLECSLSL